MFKVNEAYFYLKLRQLIEGMFSTPEKYNITDEQDNYIRILRICSLSSKAFQHFSRVAANKMIEHNFPPSIQAYLDRFLFDVRIRKPSIEDFNRMYPDNLYFIVKAVSAFSEDDDDDDNISESTNNENKIVVDLLNNLREKDFLRFVIVTTHFESVRYLLHQ